MFLSTIASYVPVYLPKPIRSVLGLPGQPADNSRRAKVAQDDSEIYGGPLKVTSSIYQSLEQGLAKGGGRPAIISTHQPANLLDDLLTLRKPSFKRDHERAKSSRGSCNSDGFSNGCLQLSYEQMQRTSLNLATGMLFHGAQHHSTILMLVPNGAEFGLLLWTSVIMRLTYICADAAVLSSSRPEERRNMLQTLKPSIIAVPDWESAYLVDALVSELRLAPPLRICIGKGKNRQGWASLEEIARQGVKSSIDREKLLEDARDDNPERIHSILFTSGTSGEPKGCPLRVGGQAHVLKSQTWLIDQEAAPFALQQAHPSRGIAPAQTLQTWRAGGAVVMTGSGFSVCDTVSAIREHGVTFLVFTPPMVHGMGERLAAESLDVSCVKRIQIGGDAVTRGVMSRCASMFPHADVCINHGMTEGGGSFVWPFFKTPISEMPFFGAICPVGVVAPGSTVRVWDADAGRLCERGVPGELHICCGSIIRHYLFGRSEDSFYDDCYGSRWFKTGDVAIMDAAGLLFILGRQKDVIRRAGTIVMPGPLESCIEEFTLQAVSKHQLILLIRADSRQTTVVSVPHPQLGQEPVAVVASLGTRCADEIKEHVRRTLGRDYALAGLLTLGQVELEEWPVNATHKIVRQRVQEAALRYLHRSGLANGLEAE